MGFILAGIAVIILAIILLDLTHAKHRAYRSRTYSADGHRKASKRQDNDKRS